MVLELQVLVQGKELTLVLVRAPIEGEPDQVNLKGKLIPLLLLFMNQVHRVDEDLRVVVIIKHASGHTVLYGGEA